MGHWVVMAKNKAAPAALPRGVAVAAPSAKLHDGDDDSSSEEPIRKDVSTPGDLFISGM